MIATSPAARAPQPGYHASYQPDRGAGRGRNPATRKATVATVAKADHLYEQPVVVDFVDEPVVTGTHSVHVRFTYQSDASRRPRFAGEQIDNRPDPLLLIAG